MSSPSICVYLPTHNRVSLLKRALNSILAQSLSASEIIVVDDGSTDGTQEFMASFCQQHPSCRYLRNDSPRGACFSRNRAIEACTSDYITGLDDDDEFMPDHLECLFNAFTPDYALVCSSLREDTGEKVIVRQLDVGKVTLADLLHYNKLGNQIFTLSERLKSIGGFDESFPAFQDYDTWVRMLHAFGPALKIKNATYVWHTAHEQVRISNSAIKRLNALALFQKKHFHLLNRQHLDSLELMRLRLSAESFSFFRFLSLVNRGNWKSATALYLNSNLKRLKFILDKIRH